MMIPTFRPLALCASALLAAAPSALAQNTNCDTDLRSQAEVDAFDCTAISSVRVDASDVTNLDGLSELTSVSGNLRIDFTPALEDVDGLAALTSVGGLLGFNSSAVRNIDGLAQIASVGGGLGFSGTSNLTNIDALANLTSIGGYLDVRGNVLLADLDGLAQLTSVGGYVEIRDNASLANLDALAGLASLPGNLRIIDNTRLERCAAGLGRILTAEQTDGSGVGGTILDIGRNGSGLAGGTADSDCNSVQSIVDAFAVLTQNCDTELFSQAEVDAFNCPAISSLFIRGNDITNLDGLSELTSVSGDLLIRETPVLANVDGLAGLTSVGGVLLFLSTPLTNVDGLAALTFVGNALSFGFNASLANVDGLAQLASVGGDLAFNNNPSLTNVDGLAGLTSTGGSVFLERNPNLARVDGLAQLTSVGGSFVLEDNGSLTSVDALAQLSSVGGNLVILSNASLANVDGLAGLSSVGNGFSVASNGTLERCAVGLGPILTAEQTGGAAVGGAINIFGNGSGLAGGTADSDCNSAQSIVAAFAALQPTVSGTLAAGTCPESLPGGDFACRVQVTGTNLLSAPQRYTVFLRMTNEAGFSRIAKRGEIKIGPNGTTTQPVKFATLPTDPDGAFTLELLAEEGSVPTPSEDAVLLDELGFFKQLAGEGDLRVAEALSVFPNPAAGAATLRFAVAERTAATLVLYDALGREVARPLDGAVEGLAEVRLDASALPAGLYVARLVANGRAETVRFSVVR